jgi:type II secretory pathway predicted ATPase ExeA
MTQSMSDVRRPFLSAPTTQRYFAAAAIEEARQRIVRAVARNEGPAILVGGAGTGKSLLLAVLAEQFAGRRAVVTLAGAQLCTRRALLQVMLCELGLPYRGMDEGELRLAILQYLRGDHTKPQAGEAKMQAGRTPVGKGGPRRVVLLVDEADSLPVRLLEELRVLTNIAAEGSPLVSLVLAGGPILEERFADPQLDMFAQRIAARCYLAPLGREETLQYVAAQVAAGGLKPEQLFTADALEAIHSATGGVPRMINQLGDQLSWMAEETGCAPLDSALVQQAWSDLQQLPAPWNTEGYGATTTGESQTIEFGSLDDLDMAILDTSGDDEAFGADDDALDAEDEIPASIPIGIARPTPVAAKPDAFDAEFEAAERLLESFDQFEGLELRAKADTRAGTPIGGSRSAPAIKADAGIEDPERPSAENPFDESFDEEEIVVDPYAAFEAEMLRAAPHVVNRLDRAFAGELHRCVQRAATVPPRAKLAEEWPDRSSAAAPLAKPAMTATAISAAEDREVDAPFAVQSTYRDIVMQLPAESASSRELLVIEDDEETTASVVPGKQFRRLFSRLEAGGRSLSG